MGGGGSIVSRITSVEYLALSAVIPKHEGTLLVPALGRTWYHTHKLPEHQSMVIDRPVVVDQLLLESQRCRPRVNVRYLI